VATGCATVPVPDGPAIDGGSVEKRISAPALSDGSAAHAAAWAGYYKGTVNLLDRDSFEWLRGLPCVVTILEGGGGNVTVSVRVDSNVAVWPSSVSFLGTPAGSSQLAGEDVRQDAYKVVYAFSQSSGRITGTATHFKREEPFSGRAGPLLPHNQWVLNVTAATE